jgi:hypothetical protein
VSPSLVAHTIWLWLCVLSMQAHAQHLAEQFRKLLQELHVTATSSWRGSVKAAVNDAIAYHKKHRASEASAEDGAMPPAAAAAELKEADREQLFRQYVSELSKTGARCVACWPAGWPVCGGAKLANVVCRACSACSNLSA